MSDLLRKLRSELMVGVPVAARALGFERTHAYQLVKAGTFPVPVRLIGSRYKVPTAPLLRYLGIEPDGPEHNGDTPHPTTDGEADNSPRIGKRKEIDPDKEYRIRATGEVVTGAELLRRRRAR